jgi:hypothetical protein
LYRNSVDKRPNSRSAMSFSCGSKAHNPETRTTRQTVQPGHKITLHHQGGERNFSNLHATGFRTHTSSDTRDQRDLACTAT